MRRPQRQVRQRFCVLVLAGLALASTPAIAQSGPGKCSARKIEAAGKYAQALAKCRAKAVAKSVAVDPICEAKALLKLEKAFVKAEGTGDCPRSGDQPAAADESEVYVGRVERFLSYRCCALPVFGECTWALDEAACTLEVDGTFGAEGSVCDGATGTCIAPPAAAGPCCEGFANPERCDAGNQTPELCASGSGVFTPSAICTPTGTCEAP